MKIGTMLGASLLSLVCSIGISQQSNAATGDYVIKCGAYFGQQGGYVSVYPRATQIRSSNGQMFIDFEYFDKADRSFPLELITTGTSDGTAQSFYYRGVPRYRVTVMTENGVPTVGRVEDLNLYTVCQDVVMSANEPAPTQPVPAQPTTPAAPN